MLNNQKVFFFNLTFSFIFAKTRQKVQNNYFFSKVNFPCMVQCYKPFFQNMYNSMTLLPQSIIDWICLNSRIRVKLTKLRHKDKPRTQTKTMSHLYQVQFRAYPHGAPLGALLQLKAPCIPRKCQTRVKVPCSNTHHEERLITLSHAWKAPNVFVCEKHTSLFLIMEQHILHSSKYTL